MKKILLLFMALVMVSSVVKAQFASNSEVLLYKKVGSTPGNTSSRPGIISETYVAVIFKTGKMNFVQMDAYWMKEHYKKDPSLMNVFTNNFRNNLSHGSSLTSVLFYDRSNSSAKYETYSEHHESSRSYWGTFHAYDFCASFSKDKGEMISWLSTYEGKNYYKKIDKKELAPKSTNRDFLYE